MDNYTIEERKEYNKKYYKKNKSYFASYYDENKEIHNSQMKEWFANNKEYCRLRMAEKRKCPSFKLSSNISTGIRNSLKTKGLSKNRKKWETMVGYTKEQLKVHLESLFTEGMTWENQGKWHIDHIIPKSFFKYTSIDDVEFKYCWSLYNLQPLWEKDNKSKSDKLNYGVNNG